MFSITYNLKMTIFIPAWNSHETLEKTESKSFDTEVEDLYSNEVILKSGNILNYFTDELSLLLGQLWLNPDQVEVEEYEVVSLTDNVNVYFKNPEDPELFTLTPQLCAVVNRPEVDIFLPEIFNGQLINDTAIRWYWSEDPEGKYAHLILDEENHIKAQIPVSVNEYYEISLSYDTNYTRKIVRYDTTGTSLISPAVTIRTNSKRTIPETLKRYIIKARDEYNTEPIEKIQERLEAFQSGIGYGTDLMVMKGKKDITHSVFNLASYLYGQRSYQEPVYTPVGFDYIVHAQGEKPEFHKEGFIRFILSAYKMNHVKIDALGKIYEPIMVYWRVGVNLTYDYISPEDLAAYQDKMNTYYDQIS